MRATYVPFVLAALAAMQAPALAGQVPPAAAPVTAHHARHHAAHAKAAESLAPIERQTPKPTPISNEGAAPVPDEWVTAPTTPALTETEVAPAVLQIHYPPQGDGFPLGSSPQAMDDREAAKVTGVEMKLPIGQ